MKAERIKAEDDPLDGLGEAAGEMPDFDAEVNGDSPLFTEDALALRFSERHANDLRYIATKGTWLKWDGVRWYDEATHLAFDLARQSCRQDARELGNGKPPGHVYSAKTIAAVERMAKADRRQATTIEEWDANELNFNAEMATFNLGTMKSYAPRPGDYITKIAGCCTSAQALASRRCKIATAICYRITQPDSEAGKSRARGDARRQVDLPGVPPKRASPRFSRPPFAKMIRIFRPGPTSVNGMD